jgi:hypothetical protein
MVATQRWGVSTQGRIDVVAGAPAYFGSFKAYLLAGIGAIAAPTTASVPVLYNPGVPTVVNAAWFPLVALRITAVHIGVVSGTLAAGGIQYGLAEGVTITGGLTTDAAIFNTFFGRGALTSAKFYTTATASVAPTCFPSGLSAGGDLAAGVLFNLTDKLGGGIDLPPGAAFWPFLATDAGSPNLTALVTVDFIQTPMLGNY